MHSVNSARPPEKQQKANKAKVWFDNHAKPLRKSKKTKTSKVFRRMQVGAYIWHFRMRFCFFSSGDDVVPTKGKGQHIAMPSPSCQTDILFKIRLEDILTRAKKAKSHAEVPNGRLSPAFS